MSETLKLLAFLYPHIMAELQTLPTMISYLRAKMALFKDHLPQ